MKLPFAPRFLLTLACAFLPASAAPPPPPAPPGTGARVDFNRQVRSILSDKCFACHGPDDQQRQVGLRLDTKAGAFADRGGSAVILPGNAAESRLYQRISHETVIARMPPPAANRTLSPGEIETIRRWIDQGAEWQTHWAYVTPQRPEPPKVEQASRSAAWPRNAIDNFIFARLDREGLEPSPEAAKATLLRRVTFDLTGLPPTPKEIDSFLKDSSPNAYEKRVERLLNSPHYGERMAMEWLDLARYADTHGYHIDSHRDMWRWRDWVINAFNRNMPYDRFTIEQLAGDLLPNATREQKIATGFNRNHMINFEGGAIPEEYQNEYVIDRLDTTATVWMAITMGCARCHNHKYDPIQQRDFYSFYAFFNTIPEKGLDGTKGNAAPMLRLGTSSQQRRFDKLERDIEQAKKKLSNAVVAPLEQQWLADALAEIPAAPAGGLRAHYTFEENLDDVSASPAGGGQDGKTTRGEITYEDGPAGRAARFSGETQAEFADIKAIGDHAFSIAFWMRTIRKTAKTVLHKIGDPGSRRGLEIYIDRATKLPNFKRGHTLYIRLAHQSPGNVIEVKSVKKIINRATNHLTISYDGGGKATGVKLFIDGEPWKTITVRDTLDGSIANHSPLAIGDRAIGKPFKGDIDDLRVYGRLLTPSEITQLAVHEPLRVLLAARASGNPCAQFGDLLAEPKSDNAEQNPDKKQKKTSKAERRCKSQAQKLRDYYLTHHASKRHRATYAKLTSMRKRRDQLDRQIPTAMVMTEMEKPRDSFILGRGDYRNKGDKVTPGVPAVLPPLPSGAPANRLGLAQWLVDPAHPLTARVAVNRYWQMYFGTGIVKTSEDFGSQGEAPSHPKLLDWLATEFVRTGWDVKAMQRLIVTSAAYRQSSRATKEGTGRDPENRLLARGSRFRLPAEIVRDNALAISGLLNTAIGGPSVYPYQPPGLWKEMSFGDRFSAQVYSPSRGADLYRRSMYTFWKRTVPPPTLATFDAPDREKCTVRRARTNTPLQALVLLNDPTYIEASRILAEGMMTQAGNAPSSRLRFAYRRALARDPNPQERQVLLTLFQKQLDEFRQNEQAAIDLLSVGDSPRNKQLNPVELAAWTTIASTILNLDETVTKE